ncbi:ras association domain-containing protein 5 isoform X1 [Nerophis ophidion]|uniref:ras association domain-containing protein 5 isoform X1 n=1 Tax=Nerophis ophidion TaxID=159077 RepID=UPI002ADFAB73|nr:ras association domain-containing protein 5 isoform X1 [Nerophis ophidion]
MASTSVVGQHRLDPEPLLRVFKPAGGRKKITLPRKSSWERIMSRRCGGECESVAPQQHAWTCREDAAGCRGATPRSPERVRRSPASRDGHPGFVITDCPTDRNHGHGETSLHGPGVGVTSTLRHREFLRSRRDLSSGQPSVSTPAAAKRDRRRPPLQRLTQGRTGVVRLARTEPPRREAWAIFPQGSEPKPGEGHRFDAKAVTQEWCDACSRQITARALQCLNCTYTCHLECERHVQLDCNRRTEEAKETTFSRSQRSTAELKKSEAREEEDGGAKDLPEEDVRARIDEYNSRVSENGMTLASDGSYTGFIKVHLRLSRPVTVPALDAGSPVGVSGGGPDGAPSEGQDCVQGEDRTSFYLPCDCVKQLHISSATTTGEVIQGLLKKFMVLDNPRKFALYRQTHRDAQDLFQKLPLCERPLLLRLLAGPDPQTLSFVLKENETGEVEWHAFSVPELQNFLVILDKEESERVRAVEYKYSVYRRRLQHALQHQEQHLDP